jgi:hypothetical protein
MNRSLKCPFVVLSILVFAGFPTAQCLVTLKNSKILWVVDDSNCSSSIVSESLNFTVHGAWSVEISQTQSQYDAGVMTLLQPRVTCIFQETSYNSSTAVARWECPWLTPDREEPVDLYVDVIYELQPEWNFVRMALRVESSRPYSDVWGQFFVGKVRMIQYYDRCSEPLWLCAGPADVKCTATAGPGCCTRVDLGKPAQPLGSQ